MMLKSGVRRATGKWLRFRYVWDPSQDHAMSADAWPELITKEKGRFLKIKHELLTVLFPKKS